MYHTCSAETSRKTGTVTYIGQTEQPFTTRFREHYNYFKYANNRSKFAQHIIQEGHNFGPMNEIMKVIYVKNKGKMLDT